MTRAYSISAESIAKERERVADDLSRFDVSRVIQMDELELRPMGRFDVHLRILAVSAEHNVDHAALADTINIVETRGGKLYPGNSAIGEILGVGDGVQRFKPGEIVLTHCNGAPDKFGYPLRIWGYDQPDSIGWYAEEAMVEEWQLIPCPLDCGLSLWEMAALPLRAPTAYHLWRRALGIYRLKVPAERQAVLNVLAFGGGVSELFLMLAASQGHNAFFCSGSEERRDALAERGIVGIDQNTFNRFATRDDVRAFTREVRQLTSGENVHIVCDMLRGPVADAGINILARQGVNVSAGWQLAQKVTYNSTIQSVKQVTLDHVHLETIDGSVAATELYGRVFKPTIHKEVYAFEDLPRCMQEMYENVQTGIPIIRVAQELPAAFGQTG